MFESTPYAFRTFIPFGAWTDGTSSAEWNEELALVVGDRVAEHEFMEMMYAAYPGGTWIGG